MELRHLRYFQVVAAELNFTRAAIALHMSQPPLSRQIAQMEDELGTLLFDRSSRALRLTEAGRFLLEQSLQITARLAETLVATRRIGTSHQRWFGIGFVPSVLYGFLPELIRELRASSPQVEVGFSELTTLQQLEALKAGRIDIGFGRIVIDDPDVTRTIVRNEQLVVAISACLAAASDTPLTPAELARHPLILYPARPRPSYADHVLALFQAEGITVRVVQEANELQTAIGLVAAGVGIALVPASVQRLHREDVIYRSLDAPGFTSPVVMSYRSGDQSPVLAKALDWVNNWAAA